MLTYHVHQGHVHEEPGCEGEYPRGDVLGVVSNQNPGDHAQVGHHGRQHVVKNGLTHRHAGLQEHRKVTWESEKTVTHYDCCTRMMDVDQTSDRELN